MAKSAIQQHIQHLRDLDREFKRFEEKMQAKMKANPDLRTLTVDLDRLHNAVARPAYGLKK